MDKFIPQVLPRIIEVETAEQYNLRRQKEVFGISEDEIYHEKESFGHSLIAFLFFAGIVAVGIILIIVG